MFNPPHPGSILKEDVLPELGIGVTEAAVQLGVARETFSRVINCQSAVSIDMAIRLEAWLIEPTAESWLRMQAEYDLWQARQSQMLNIKPVKKRPLIKSVLINSSANEKSDKEFPIIDKAERTTTNLVGLQLKKARNMFGVTIPEAVQHLKISEENLKLIEKKFNMECIPLKLIKSASEFYNVSVYYLFGLNEDWESAPEVRRERDFISYMHRRHTDELIKLAAKFIKLENKSSAVGEIVANMALAYRRIDTAFMKFNNLNPDFKDMSGGTPLLREIKRAVEDGERVTNLLQRYKILPKNTTVTHGVTGIDLK